MKNNNAFGLVIPAPMPHITPDIVAVSDDDLSINFFPHVEVSESEERIWFGHSNIADDYTNDYGFIGPRSITSSYYFWKRLLQLPSCH